MDQSSTKEIALSKIVTEAERATAVGKYFRLTGNDHPDSELAAALGIASTHGVFDTYRRVYELGEKVMNLLHENRLTFGCAVAVIDAPKAERAALIELFTSRVSPNRNTARRIAENTVAAALAQGISVEELLREPVVAQALTSESSGPQKIASVDQALHRLRYPQLTEAREKALALVAKLDLPKAVRIDIPASLEARPTFSISPGSAEELAKLAAKLSEAAQTKTAAELFKVLGR
jgi:hypothetical protein